MMLPDATVPTPDAVGSPDPIHAADSLDPATFAELWDRTSSTHADRPFLVFQDADGSVGEWTYGEFRQIVDSVASRLALAGVGHGDGIHICLRNSPGFVALWLASSQIGAWINPVDPSTTAREIGEQLERTHPALGIVGSEQAETYRDGARDFDGPVWEVAESISGLDVLASADESGTAEDRTASGSSTAPAGTAPAGTALAPSSGATSAASSEPPVVPAPLDRLAVMFTSGTTSRPKGVVLTQSNYRHVARDMALAADLRPEHRWYVVLPLFHANAQYYCFASAIDVGASVALTSSFSASGWVAGAIALKATHASLFAAPIRMILARTPEAQPPAELEHVWFAQNLGLDHHARFAVLAGVVPRQLYGMTETIAIVTYDRSQPPVNDLIGPPIPGRRGLLVDPVTLEPVESGTVGMIAVAGRRGHDLFQEYLDDPRTTGRTLVQSPDGDDLLLTGDLAVDTGEAGWRFVGRNDDVIKVSGENVSLTEIEAALAQAPGVLEAAVLAEADPIRDVVPVAYIVAKDPSAGIDVDALDAWARANLSKAAQPRKWHQIAELPRTSVGKVRRFKLDAEQQSGQPGADQSEHGVAE